MDYGTKNKDLALSNSQPLKIFILSTGGTIEKSYDERAGALGNQKSFLKDELLPRLRLPFTDVEVITLMNKDSLEMTDRDRKKIVKVMEGLASDGPVVVIHGTDTMVETANFCEKELEGKLAFPVVFTGAMKPMGFSDSDASQNIAEALLSARLLKTGIYITFHNNIYLAKEAMKNRDLGTFTLQKG